MVELNAGWGNCDDVTDGMCHWHSMACDMTHESRSGNRKKWG